MDASALFELLEAQPPGYVGDPGEEFTYGEITLEGLRALLSHAALLPRQAGETPPVPRCFLDLGSGTGKAVIAAAVLFPGLQRCIGVELSEDRHSIALHTLEVVAARAPEVKLYDRVTLVLGDARSAVASIAASDVVWLSNTCFSEELSEEIAAAIDDFAPEGAVVYATHPPRLQRGVVQHAVGAEVDLQCSWTQAHRALAHMLRGRPTFLWPGASDESACPTGTVSHCGNPCRPILAGVAVGRSFDRWSSSYAVVRAEAQEHEGCAESGKQVEYSVVDGDCVLAAVATCLMLAGIPGGRVFDLIHRKDATVADLCICAVSRWPGGLSAEAFGELCAQCFANHESFDAVVSK